MSPSVSPSAAAASSPSTPPASATTTPTSAARTSAASASTGAGAAGTVSPQGLLERLRTRPFAASGLPAHLHPAGVGVWDYVDAGHVGAGYVGSAKVSFRSDLAGEKVLGIYDVFDSGTHAAAGFATAEENFRANAAGGFHEVSLTPRTAAFCAPQGDSSRTTTCWMHDADVDGIVTVTAPPSGGSGDGPAVLQAMLTHLLAVRG